MLTLTSLNTPLAVCRLDSTDPTPDWAASGPFTCVTRTPEELSVVCAESQVPPGVRCERGWRALKVEGPLDFSLVGILATLADVLAQAGVSIFAISTFDTDYILVRGAHLAQALAALQQSGYTITHP